MSSLHVPSLPDEASQRLLAEFSEEEVWEALKYMKAFKSPGLDGFQPFFFKKFWHIVSDDIWWLVREGFISGSFDPCLLETLIVLIPKVEVPDRFSQFRPISFWNVIYKIITNVLINHLRLFCAAYCGSFLE